MDGGHANDQKICNLIGDDVLMEIRHRIPGGSEWMSLRSAQLRPNPWALMQFRYV